MASAIFWKDANAYDVFDGGMIVLDSEIFTKKAESPKKSRTIKTK